MVLNVGYKEFWGGDIAKGEQWWDEDSMRVDVEIGLTGEGNEDSEKYIW